MEGHKTMKSLFRNSLLSLWGVILATACYTDTVYHSYQSLPCKGWSKSDTVFFQVSLTDPLPNTLKVFAEVRNRTDYPYRNLHLFVCHNLPDSTNFRTDTLEFSIADKEGKWQGNGWGGIYVSECPVREEQEVHPGKYTFKVIHGMKDERLMGINDIGIRIQK